MAYTYFFKKNSMAFRPVFVSFVKPVCLAMLFLLHIDDFL